MIRLLLYIIISIHASSPSPPTDRANLEFKATVVATMSEGKLHESQTSNIAISKTRNAMSKMQMLPAKNMTQSYLCSKQEMILLEPFFDEVVCYAFAFPQVSKTECPFEEVVPGLATLAHAKYIGKITYEGQDADKYELISTIPHQTRNETWVLKDTQLLAYMMHSNLSAGLTETFVFTDVQPVTDDDFSAPENCDKIGINSTYFNPFPFKSKDITHVNQPEWIQQINEDSKTWEAGETEYMGDATIFEFQKTLGTTLSPGLLPRQKPHDMIMDQLPDSFDAREQWPKCDIGVVRNQGSCGSCWAFGATESMEDRYCIKNEKTIKLSPEYIVSCDKQDNGCGGGFLDLAWQFLKNTGIPVDDCMPYEHCAYTPFSNCTKPGPAPKPTPNPHPDKCPSKCTDGSEIQTITAKNIYGVAKPGDVKQMQMELMKNGPFEVAFWVFSDFMQYKGGIYQLTPKAAQMGMMGGHAVKLIGWGSENGTDYWTIANSWGTNWGEDGFWRIIRGKNECGIESTPAAGDL